MHLASFGEIQFAYPLVKFFTGGFFFLSVNNSSLTNVFFAKNKDKIKAKFINFALYYNEHFLRQLAHFSFFG